MYIHFFIIIICTKALLFLFLKHDVHLIIDGKYFYTVLCLSIYYLVYSSLSTIKRYMYTYILSSTYRLLLTAFGQ